MLEFEVYEYHCSRCNKKFKKVIAIPEDQVLLCEPCVKTVKEEQRILAIKKRQAELVKKGKY